MSFKFGTRSLSRIEECHPDLQRIAHELIKEMDITIICGHRGEKDQNSAFINGKSKLQWPRSKHNRTPSEAIDMAPWPLNWDDTPGFMAMCSKVESIAERLKIKIRLGRDFSFGDMPHIELHDKHKK